MQNRIQFSIDQAMTAAQLLNNEDTKTFISELSGAIAFAFENGNKILIAGNGGSLCDAMHFAEELTGYYREKRKAFPAIALADPGHLTCVGNDAGFDYVFSRGIEALGKPGDIFIAMTTSGNSRNLINATKKANEMGLKTVAFIGKTGGLLKGLSDLEWIVTDFKTSDRIQELHMVVIHIVIEMIEYLLIESKIEIEQRVEIST